MLTAISTHDLAGEWIPGSGRLLDIAFFSVLRYAALCQLIGIGVYDRVVRSFDIVLREFAVIANQPLCQMVGDILLLQERVADVLSTLMTVVLGSLMAFAISLVNSKFLRTVYMTSILLICIPIHAIILQLVPLLKTIGLINTYLGTSFVFTALSLPVAVFLYTGFMRTLPRELSEAAVVDGCGLWRIYSSIYMPLMKTITVTVIILRATYIWNDLLVSLVTISDATKTMLVPRMYAFNSSTSTRWDLVLASSVLVSIPVAALYLFLQKFYMRGLVSGAVKE